MNRRKKIISHRLQKRRGRFAFVVNYSYWFKGARRYLNRSILMMEAVSYFQQGA